MDALFHAFLRAGLFGSIIILLVLLLRLCLKKAPRQLVCILWLLVAVRLVLPFTIESRLSLQPEVPEFSDTMIQQPVTPPVQTPGDLPVVPPVSRPQQNIPPVTAPPITTPEPPKTITWEQLLPVIWLCGVSAMAIYGVVSYLLLKRRLRDAVREEGCMVSDRVKGAFVAGYLKPRIYLSACTEAQDRPYIIAHEQAHIARGDHWWKLLGFVCLCLHWYNPLVWVSFVLFGRDTEVACDERVVWGMELEERKAYSMALLNSGRQMSGLVALTLCFGKESLKQRIKNVLSFRKPGIWITALAGMLAVAIAIFFLTSPQKTDPKPTDPTDNTTIPTTQGPTDSTTVPPTTGTPTTAPTDPTTVPPTTVPPTTAPVETVPPTTAPPETVPPTTAPPVTEPPVTEPPVTEPPVTEPPVVYNGTCGENVQWTLTGGILTISGSGDITSSPWLEYREELCEVIIREGVTSIPAGTFAGCGNLLYVTVEPGVTYVGTNAFADCGFLMMYWHGSAPEFARAWIVNGRAEIHYPEGDESWKEARKNNHEYGVDFTAVSYALSGSCGENLTYTIDGTVMTISGTGKMDSYSSAEPPPWVAYDHFITELIIEDGVTSIGSNAFSQFDSITELVIPDSVTVIESMGFKDCTSLRTITLSKNLTHIWDFVFDSCVSLTELHVPKSVTVINADAFGGSAGVKMIWFYGDAPMGLDFWNITATAYYPGDNPTWTQERLENYGGNITWIAMN